MDSFGFWSVLPPLIAIVIAIRTKQVFASLLFGIWLGWVIINGGNLFSGTLDTIQALVDVFKDPGNTRTIMFSALVGSLILLIQQSGGVQGFINWVENFLKRYEHKKGSQHKKLIQLIAWFTGILIFVETSISSLTVGTLFRPLFDKLKIPREKLAYIADSSSAPISILLPFNAWGAFIMGLLIAEGFENPFSVLFQSMVFNFYPILALIIVPLVIISGKDLGPMAKAERRARKTGKVLADNAQPMLSNELTRVKPKGGIAHRAYNMVIPISVMVLMMPVMLAFTGWASAMEADPASSGLDRVLKAIGQGSGSTAVLTAVVTALFVSFILFRIQKIMRFKEMIDSTLKGISELMPLALLMMLAFGISAVCKQLETGNYVAELARQFISPELIPFIVFIISSFIAFSTGTSWGTFAIMISIAVPMAQNLDVNVYLTIAAALGGGVFGDHASPISDTTIISSMASASDHIDHVKTQLPYALLAGSLAALLYLILGFIYA
jgi:tetracycline resistance efflux pump